MYVRLLTKQKATNTQCKDIVCVCVCLLQLSGERQLCQHLCRQAVLVQAVLLLVTADACQFGEAEATADPGQFGLGRRCHCLASTDALLLVDCTAEQTKKHKQSHEHD